MSSFRRTTPCWLIVQTLCFCLLLQGSGIAHALPLPPKPTFVSKDDLDAARLRRAAAGADEAKPGLLKRFAGDAWSTAAAAGSRIQGWLEDAWAPATVAASQEEPLRIAQVGSVLPAPARLMPAVFAAPLQGGPPGPPRRAGGEIEATPPAEAAKLLEKSGTDEIPLVAGWNLISIPLELTDPSPAAVFAPIAGQLVEAAHVDVCDAADPEKIYDPADPAASDLAAVTPGMGLWVKVTTATILPLAGTLPAATTIELCPGWNQLGVPTAEPRHPYVALSSIAGKWQRVFGHDAFDTQDPWEYFDPVVPAWANDMTAMRPGYGYWVLASEAATLTIRNQGPPPTVALAAPVDLSVVTQPTQVTATVDSDRLESWTLTSRPIGDGEPVTLATGNAPISGPGVLATLDPTLLLNGLYELELIATDVQGQQVSESIAVSVEGQMKIGHFTLSFVDLAIALSGLDIEVVRTYDSRDKQQRDFGVGWSLDVRQGSYVNNRPPGDGWQLQTGFLPCDTVIESKSHLTVVRLSDQEVYRFALKLQDGELTGGGCFATARFDYVDGPLPGSTLEIPGNTKVFWENGSDEVIDANSFELYEPQDVRLTTRDGRIFELDLTDGVTGVEDNNGNRLTITSGGISHSSGQSIDFTRNAQDRIIEITDPRGATISYASEPAGDLVAVTDREGHTTTMTYDDRHLLLDIFDPLGNRAVRTNYDEVGRVISTTDAAGHTISFVHDLATRREVITDRLGFVQVMEYDQRGNVVREIDKLGNVSLATYDGRDNLLTETDPLDRTTTHTYTAADDLASTADPLGNTTTFTYDSAGRMLTTTDPRNNVTTNTYDAVGNLLSTTDPLGNVTNFTYDADGNVLTHTDARGNVTSFVYDSKGNMTRQTDPLDGRMDLTYNAIGDLLSSSRTRTVGASSETLTTTYTRNNLGRVLSETAPDGSFKTYSYDAGGRILTVTDEVGQAMSMAYDVRGDLTSMTYADGTSLVHAYDAEGREVGLTARTGYTATKAFDALGRHQSTTMPDGAVTSSTYDAAGQLIAQTAADDNALEYTYDAAGRRISYTDPSGTSTSVYDASGNQVAVTDPLGNTTTMTYDAMNRRTKVTYPDGTSIQTAYDELGQRASTTDPDGNVTLFGYDAAGRLATMTDALGQVTQYAYDELGSLIAQTDSEGRTTSFTYDRLGRQTSRTYPGGGTETFTYNPDGTVASRTDPNGVTTLYTWDVNKRLIRRSYPDGSDVTFTYTANGQRASYTDDRGLTAYTYDSRDRPTSVTYPDGRSLSYTYDGLSRRTSMTALVGSSTFSTTYGYDVASRLTTVVDHQGGTTTLGYAANGNMTNVSFPNGVTTNYTETAQVLKTMRIYS